MNKQTILITTSLFFILPTIHATAKSTDNSGTLTISATKLDINDKALNLVYEIRNDSEDDAWILVGWYQLSDSTFGMAAGLQMAEDGYTLTISARFNRPSSGGGFQPSYGRFVRLRPGDSQTESIFMRLPVYPASQSGHDGQQEQGIKHATRLAIELGYYRGNLPERILKTHNPPMSRGANWLNEYLNSREDELLIWEDFSEFISEGEQVIRTVIENLNIPYEQKRNYTRKIKSPGLHSFEKIEIQYKPSILEFFFPYESQPSLLSPDEMEYLQSDKTIVLNNKQDIHTVAHFIPHTRADTTVFVGLPVRYRSHAEVVCYSAGKPFLSFSIYNDDKIVIDGYELFSFEGLPSLKKLTPQIQAIDLRLRCAANLKNQWYRFRSFLFHEAIHHNDPSIRNQIVYPTPFQWCDSIRRSYPVYTREDWWKKLHACPSAGEGKNHYAMNPNCKPDSPADMVLLFETKSGWNQHGGPELFTFDNHNPKGGCVLFNDGTVTFIRTKEELQQIRWK